MKKISYTAARDMDNKRLAKEGKPYRYDDAGYARCLDCGAYWHEKHGCDDGDYYASGADIHTTKEQQ